MSLKEKSDMYKSINFKNYDFLWSVGGQCYFFTSIWLHKEFLSRDFVNVCENNINSLYISKKQREILSCAGLKLFGEGFRRHENRIKKQLKITKKFIFAIECRDLNVFSNKTLVESFMEVVCYWQYIWSQYFWTEYFCHDRVAQVLKEKNISFDLKAIQGNVQKMARLKWKQRCLLNKTFYPGGMYEKYFNIIAKRLGLGKKLNNYHYQEVIDLLCNKKVRIPDRTVVVKGRFSGWQDILGSQAKKIIQQLQCVGLRYKKIMGNIGNYGFCRGRVKKINFSQQTNYIKEAKLMKKGDILISGSTGPEMIIACRKAGAIITDEGGLLSHAAIVSRELNIPCIVGTKIATTVLRNGDMVEVDANKGIVRKIV